MAGALAWELADRIYRSRLAAKLLFGVRVPPIPAEDHYFDATSWVLLHRALPELEPSSHLVDLGTGSQAILAIALWKRSGCRVTAIDVDPELADSARANAERNQAPIHVIESHLFEGLDAAFDLVVFNPPYVPTHVGVERGLPESRRSQWDGGSDGLCQGAKLIIWIVC